MFGFHSFSARMGLIEVVCGKLLLLGVPVCVPSYRGRARRPPMSWTTAGRNGRRGPAIQRPWNGHGVFGGGAEAPAPHAELGPPVRSSRSESEAAGAEVRMPRNRTRYEECMHE